MRATEPSTLVEPSLIGNKRIPIDGQSSEASEMKEEDKVSLDTHKAQDKPFIQDESSLLFCYCDEVEYVVIEAYLFVLRETYHIPVDIELRALNVSEYPT